MRINDELLNALADRWPNIPNDYPGQTFESWLATRMHYYNEYGYSKVLTKWDDLPINLWDLITEIPPAHSTEDYFDKKAQELREIGGTFIQRIEDLRPLARVVLSMGV